MQTAWQVVVSICHSVFAQRTDEVIISNPILRSRIIVCLASGGLECHMLVARGNPMARDQPSPKVREWLLAAKRGSLGRSCVSPITTRCCTCLAMNLTCNTNSSVVTRRADATGFLNAHRLSFKERNHGRLWECRRSTMRVALTRRVCGQVEYVRPRDEFTCRSKRGLRHQRYNA